jgi:quinohemoprotein ethanol dehydrogenase
MRRLISVVAGTAFVLGFAACVGSGGGSSTGTSNGGNAGTRSAKADPAAMVTNQWAANGGDYSEQRHSPLAQINTTNLQQLGVAWYADLVERGQYQSTPLVVDGKLIITTPWSKAYAFDAKTGRQLWKYDPKVPREVVAGVLCCNVANRGAAYWNGKVIWATLDGRLVAVDIDDGKKVWESLTVDRTKALSITGAPRIGNGIVFIGQGGAEYLQRGYLSGWDAETGKKLWHWWAVPGNPADGFADQPEMEWAAKTWKGEWWKNGGGGTPWDGIIYDPQTDLVIMGTGNGSPWPAGTRSPGGGDNLFTASIVALHAKTGKYAWHYQATPMDSWDYDNTSPFTIADIVINGQKKHVVMQAPKNGFLYVIEVATGKVLSADLIVPGANWLTGFDEKNNWKPILNPHADPGRTMQGWTVTPLQAHLWYPQAFNPQTGLIYIPTRWGSLLVVAQPDLTISKQGIVMQGGRSEFAPPNLGNHPTAYLQAWDPVKRKAVWKSTEGSGSNGVLSTAGNLIFQGKGNDLLAFRADTGEKLWSTAMNANFQAGFITYAIDGVQYLAGAGAVGQRAGGRLMVLKLGGNMQVPAPAPAPQPVLNPPPNFGDAAMLAKGSEKYSQLCTICHEARRNVGDFPDLKMSPFLNTAAAFRTVVLDGALEEAGMLPFKALAPEDVEAIRAHIVSLANEQKAGAGAGGGRAGGAPGAGARGGGAAGRAGGPGGAGGRGGGAAAPDSRPPQPGGGMGIHAEGAAPQTGGPANGEPAQEALIHQ